MQHGGNGLAQVKQPGEAKMLFVCGDLKDAVCGCVANGPTGRDVGGAMICDHLGARGMTIAEDAANAGRFAYDFYDRLRKGRVRVGKIVPIPWYWNTSEFPMARRGVLAARAFGCGTIWTCGQVCFSGG